MQFNFNSICKTVSVGAIWTILSIVISKQSLLLILIWAMENSVLLYHQKSFPLFKACITLIILNTTRKDQLMCKKEHCRDWQ